MERQTGHYQPEPGSIPLRNWNLLPIPELELPSLELPSLEIELELPSLEFELELHYTELYSELKSDMMSLV